jgi:hypothetical protein
METTAATVTSLIYFLTIGTLVVLVSLAGI